MSLRGHFAHFSFSFTDHGIADEADRGQSPTVDTVSRTLILSTGHRGSENGGVRDNDATDSDNQHGRGKRWACRIFQ